VNGNGEIFFKDMKIKFIILILLFLISCEKKESYEEKKPDKMKYAIFEGKNILNMKGKTVYKFLNYLNRLDYQKQHFMWDYYLQGWTFYYKDSITIDFYFNNYKYMKNTKYVDKIYISDPTWTIDNLMKETVQAVHIVKHVRNGGLVAGFGKTYY
jgi:hypothetical protein